MKLLEEEFEQLQSENPGWSSYTVFINLIMRKRFDSGLIRKGFNNLVDRDDYDKKDKYDIIDYILSVSKFSEDREKLKNKNTKKIIKKPNKNVGKK